MTEIPYEIAKLTSALSARMTADSVREMYRQQLIDIRDYINVALDTDSDKRADENIKRMKKAIMDSVNHD
jgi:hypothetical protein